VLQETSDAPLKVITAPHTSAGTIPRSLSTQHDSTAPDSALPPALFSSRVPSSGTGEGNYGEQTQDNLIFDDGRTSFPVVLRPDPVHSFPLECSVQSDYVIPPGETHLYPHRLSREYYGPPPVVSATPPPLRHSQRIYLYRLQVLSSLRHNRCIRLDTPLPDFLHIFRLLLWIRWLPMNLSTPLLPVE
jgi:hypothetical protein